MMKKIFTGLVISSLIISLVGFNSCKSRTPEQKQKKETEKNEKKMIPGQIKENVYPLPTSAEVIKMLTDLEIGYTVGLTNPVQNVKKYFSSTSKAINMGVFGADLSYVTLYNINQEVINYLDAIRSLANELQMSKIYNEDLYDKIKQNFDNKDELVKILTKAFNETYGYLNDNDEKNLALLVVGGAWVEGMYLTTHVTEEAYNAPGFARVMLEQKKSLNEFYDITQAYMSDKMVADFVHKLDPVKKVYDGLSDSLKEQDIKDLSTVIVATREQIIAE